jgi:hypothetical protein
MAEVKSRRASREELREAGKRVKELEQELLTTVPLSPETKQGEDRRSRYLRLLRLRNMRDDFTSTRPIQADHPNGYILALVMTVACVLLCGFCAGGAFVGLQLLNFKPSPVDTANAFWAAAEQQNYSVIHTNYLSPTLRVIWDDPTQFASMAEASDSYYGAITNFSLIKQAGDMTQTAYLTYTVTRSKNGVNKIYNATLKLVIHAGSWGIDDLGASLDPSVGGALPPIPTPTTQPTLTPAPTYTPINGATPSTSPGAYRSGASPGDSAA